MDRARRRDRAVPAGCPGRRGEASVSWRRLPTASLGGRGCWPTPAAREVSYLAVTVPSMYPIRRPVGTVGRYQAACADGFCIMSGIRGTSKIESDIFTILNYVLSPGQQQVTLSGSGERADVDMIFGDGSRSPLVIVEYDSAYFHKDKQQRDLRKAENLTHWFRPAPCVVMRIRENPLDLLRRPDVRVPTRADAATCARLILLHLQHLAPFEHGDWYEVMTRSYSFLLAGARPLEREQVACGGCWRIEEAGRRQEPKPVVARPRRGPGRARPHGSRRRPLPAPQ